MEKSRSDNFEDTARLLKLLGHPVRLALLNELSKGTKCVNDIRDLVEVRQANVSQHLAALRQERLVSCRVEGNMRCYYLLQPDFVCALLQLLHSCPAVVEQRSEQVQ